MSLQLSSAQYLIQLLATGLLQEWHNIEEDITKPVTNVNSYVRHSWETYLAWSFEAGKRDSLPLTLSIWIALLHTPLINWPLIGEVAFQLEYTESLLKNGQPTLLCQRIGEPFTDTVDPQLEI